MKYLLLTIRYLLFCLFFAAGAAALTLAMLIDPEIVNYYKSRAQLEQTVRDNQKIVSVTRQYDAQIALIEREPNILRRLEQITLGQLPAEKDTAYPAVYDPQLFRTAGDILKQARPAAGRDDLPERVRRCSTPKYRRALMLAGAGLILVCFVFFNTPRRRIVRTGAKSARSGDFSDSPSDLSGPDYHGP